MGVIVAGLVWLLRGSLRTPDSEIVTESELVGAAR
jgi:hypothetical protein